MKVIKGSKAIDLNSVEFSELRTKFEKVVIDLGTGDGRFIYKSALAEPNTLFIGVDPAPKQTDEFSKKVARKKVKNVLFVVGSFELLPNELMGCADKLYIILPWGSLLKAVAEPTDADLATLRSLLKDNAEIEIIFGYDSELEPTQTIRLELDEINENKVIQKFGDAGFKLLQSMVLSGTELREIESTWGKRISSTRERRIFKLVFQVQ